MERCGENDMITKKSSHWNLACASAFQLERTFSSDRSGLSRWQPSESRCRPGQEQMKPTKLRADGHRPWADPQYSAGLGNLAPGNPWCCPSQHRDRTPIPGRKNSTAFQDWKAGRLFCGKARFSCRGRYTKWIRSPGNPIEQKSANANSRGPRRRLPHRVRADDGHGIRNLP